MLHRYPRLAPVGLFLLPGLLATPPARAQAPGWDGAYPGSLSTVPGTSVISAVATDAQGNVFVTGNFTRTVVFGNTTLTSTNGSDLFVAKYVPGTNTWAWAQRGGGTNADAGYAIAVSGNRVYVTGAFYNSTSNANAVTFGPATSPVTVVGTSSSGSQDLVLARYTDNGSSATLDWVQTGGGTGGDYGSGVAVSGNRVYVLGSVQNNRANTAAVVFGGNAAVPGTTVVRGATTTASTDWVLARYTDYGPFFTLDWTQVAGGTENDYSTGVAVSGASVYALGVIGNTSTNANAVVFGAGGDGSAPGGLYPQAGVGSLPSSDFVLAKYTDNDTNGSFGWSQVGGGTGNDYGYGVAVSGSNVYVAGHIYNNTANAASVLLGGSGLIAGANTVSGAGATVSLDMLLAKYQDDGASGSYQWSQVGGGTSYDIGQAVAVSGNRVYVAGQLHNSAGNANAVVFGTGGTVSVPGLGPTDNDDMLLACYTDNGATGTYNWVKLGGGNQFDCAYGVAVSGQQVYAGGALVPPATFGPVTLTTTNNYALNVLVRLTDPVLTPLATGPASPAPGPGLHPNPTRAGAMLSGAAPGATVQVLDVLGRVVAATTADATGQALLGQLPAGLYLVRTGSSTLRLRSE